MAQDRHDVVIRTDIGPWWQGAALEVQYAPRARHGERGDLLIGVGEAGGADADACVVLNPKSLCVAKGSRPFRSVSELVSNASEQDLQRWRHAFPDGSAGIRRLVVEDASPDTCLAILLFGAQIDAGVAAPGHHAGKPGPGEEGAPSCLERLERLKAWVDYITQWELGHYPDRDETFAQSAACQLSALAHGHLAQRPPDHAGALRACLTLLDAYVALNDAGFDARPPEGLPEFVQSQSLLAFEQQHYRLAVRDGVTTQLMLPVRGSSRRLLVDALIVRDAEMGGLLKTFCRNDRLGSPSGRGFALLAMHRPALAGSGNDMVISVDPRVGVTLEPLWTLLEQREDEAWGAARPRDNPRPGIARYTDPDTGRPARDAPNQPWYDEAGRFTLLAAPKALADGQAGTRLSWADDVLPLLWQAFVPIDVRDGSVQVEANGGRLMARVRWARGAAPALGDAPVFHQWLAGHSTAVALAHPGTHLPVQALTVRHLPGGAIVAHAGGVTILDDWTATDLDEGLTAVAHRMATLAHGYRELLRPGTVAELLDELGQVLADVGRIGARRVFLLRERILAVKTRLTALSVQEEDLRQRAAHCQLVEAVEKAWDLPDVRHRLWDSIGRMEELLAQAQSLAIERSRYLTAAILSAAGVVLVAREGIDAMSGALTMDPYEVAIPIAQRMGVPPATLEAMHASAGIAAMVDAITIAACAAILLAGLGLGIWRYLRNGSRKPAPPAAAPAGGAASPQGAPERGSARVPPG